MQWQNLITKQYCIEIEKLEVWPVLEKLNIGNTPPKLKLYIIICDYFVEVVDS